MTEKIIFINGKRYIIPEGADSPRETDCVVIDGEGLFLLEGSGNSPKVRKISHTETPARVYRLKPYK